MKVYNTLTGKKEEFVPREKGKVSMYICGPTVYNFIHIGNARAYIAFDAIFRYLKYKGYDVTYVRNLTDVDDKIIKRAQEEKTTPENIAEKYTKAFHKDMDILGVEKPSVEPKATEHIEGMIEVVEKLIENKLAYVVDGDVYYSVAAFKGYGKLSRRSLDDMIAGSRVEVNPRKKHPMDFALWKKAKEGEPAWSSPWGQGRPGWHIECSTMSMKYLEFGFDIHGGGQDLIFPHHENEIAQAEGSCSKEPFVRYWLHNGFLNIEKEKMAKSVGNVVLINDLEDQYEGRLTELRNDLRMLFLSTHYHSPINYSDEKMAEAASANKRIVDALTRINSYLGKSKTVKKQNNSSNELNELQEVAATNKNIFEKAMEDDFSTPLALAAIFNLVKHINTFLDKEPPLNGNTHNNLEHAYHVIDSLTELLGFDLKTETTEKEIPQDIQNLVNERENARKNEDFVKSDSIRDKLLDAGYEVEDTPHGPKLKIV